MITNYAGTAILEYGSTAPVYVTFTPGTSTFQITSAPTYQLLRQDGSALASGTVSGYNTAAGTPEAWHYVAGTVAPGWYDLRFVANGTVSGESNPRRYAPTVLLRVVR